MVQELSKKIEKTDRTANLKKIFYRGKRYGGLYIFLAVAVVWYFVFCYIPLYGVTLAFKDFSYAKGILGSDWVGLKYFKTFIFNPQFWDMVKNTVIISSLKLILCFPMPLVFALMLNEVRYTKCKKVMQTVSYLPHFVSWVVIVTLLNKFVSPYGGIINEIREALWGAEPVYYMGDTRWFYPLIVITHNYKTIGWSSIIYLSAIAGIDQELYEAAAIDGAGHMRRLLSITVPGLLPTIVLLFIMNVGGLLSAGFDQLYLMSNPSNADLSNVLDVYGVNVGIKGGKFSLATAVGLFQSAISFIIVFMTNFISKRVSNISLW